MRLSLFISTRALLLTCNFFLMMCGLLLVVFGFLILCDWPKVLMSRLVLPIVGTQNLPQPPLYYAALILLGTGLIICSAAVLGCWSACVFNYCILTVTFLMVLILLLSECIICGMFWLWPSCIGLSVSPIQLARTLQRSYGKPGFEQYTAAVDFAQTNFNCCGISKSSEYDSSVWKLQGLSHQSLVVPITCCVLANFHDEYAYLKPVALNISKCQAQDLPDFNFRHQQGCITKLEKWFKEQYAVFLIVGFIVSLVEFCVLVSILLSCTRVNRYRNKQTGQMSMEENINETLPRKINENIYENEEPVHRFRSDAYTLSRSFRQNYRINNSKA